MHNPCSRTTASPTLEHTWISGLDVQALGKAASMEPCISQPAPKGGRRLPAVVALKKWGTSEGRQYPLQCERQHRQKLLAVEVAEAEPARALPPALGSPGFVRMAPAGSLANAHVPSWWPYSEVLESSGSRV